MRDATEWGYKNPAFITFTNIKKYNIMRGIKKTRDLFTIEGLEGCNPKLKGRPMSEGRYRLLLSYYTGYSYNDKGTAIPRYKFETLKLYLWREPKTEAQRNHNRETLALARRIRYEKEQQFTEAQRGYRVRPLERMDIWQYFGALEDTADPGKSKYLRYTFRRFHRFITETPRYKLFADTLDAEGVTPEMCLRFAEWLERNSEGTGARQAFGIFSRAVRGLLKRGYIVRNPCEGVRVRKGTPRRKDFLTMDEIRQLIETPTPRGQRYGEVDITRRAFIFTLYTGIRFCDIIKLRYTNVDYNSRLLRFVQSKVAGRSSSDAVAIPLSDYLLTLIGEPEKRFKGGEDMRIFPLFNDDIKRAEGILKGWTRAAGIDKHITWHCGRHSFAVNLLRHGTDIKTAAELLGHSSIEMTEKYLHIVDEDKVRAINTLPTFGNHETIE